jgi:hypothetical protein
MADENRKETVDAHCHVGLLGDQCPQWGRMSESYTQQLVYRAFLFYARMPPDHVSDHTLREATEKAIDGSGLDHVVCLALDPVYDQQGQRREDLSYMWVDNGYVVDLRRNFSKVLLGASVHPYDPDFRARVQEQVDQGAVLLKWLPSAQQIDLADARVKAALQFLATARDGAPLPLLLHLGPEYAIPSTDPRTTSYDYLTWNTWDRVRNLFLGRKKKLFRPRTGMIRSHLRAGLEAGATVIFAHCGLPYYAPNWLGQVFEHSEFKAVSHYLHRYPADSLHGGRCYADVSACVTPVRRTFYQALEKLPPQSLLFGSDFPTPVFELSAGASEVMEDFKAMLRGELDRIVVPEDNLLQVNYRELQHFFPDHPMFTNFSALL